MVTLAVLPGMLKTSLVVADLANPGNSSKAINLLVSQPGIVGLVRGKRHHVHLSKDVETARKVGARRGKPVILTVDAGRMHKEGHKFLLSANGVWLTDSVAPAYLTRT